MMITMIVRMQDWEKEAVCLVSWIGGDLRTDPVELGQSIYEDLIGKFKMCCWPFPYCSVQMFLYFQCLLPLCSFSSSWVSLFVITNEDKWSDCYIQDWTSDNPRCLLQSPSHFLLFFLLQLLTLSLSDLSNTPCPSLIFLC